MRFPLTAVLLVVGAALAAGPPPPLATDEMPAVRETPAAEVRPVVTAAAADVVTLEASPTYVDVPVLSASAFVAARRVTLERTPPPVTAAPFAALRRLVNASPHNPMPAASVIAFTADRLRL